LCRFSGQAYGGKAIVTIFNSGLVYADFYTEIANCSDPINAVPAQKVAISPYYSAELVFELVSRAVFSAKNRCNVSVYDSEFGFLDSYLVEFNTTDRVTNNGTQGGEGGPPLSASFGNRGNGSSDGVCNCGFLDFPCYIFRNCWSQLIGILITAAVVIVAAILLCKCGPRLLRLLKPGKGGKSSKKSSKTIKIKTEEKNVEMEEYSQKSSLAAGKAPTPMSTPQKVKPVLEDSIAVVIIPKQPEFSSMAGKPATEAELRAWSQNCRLVYLNISDESVARKFTHFPGRRFSVAGALVEFKLPTAEGVDSPWSFELCVGFENQKWYTEGEINKVKPIVFPLIDELPRCLNTVLDTATACQLISKRPKYPCINRDATSPELVPS
jgi:hypothetical protein